MKLPVIHYAGALNWRLTSRNTVVKVLEGYAACCSGPRAIKIRDRGHHTYDRDQVTCKLCRAAIARAEG